MPLTIDIAPLTSTPTTREESIGTDWCAERLGPVYRPVGDSLAVHVKVSRVADLVEASGRVTGRFAFDCSRCAAEAELSVDAEFEHHFVGAGQLDAGGEDDDGFDADPDVSEHDGARVDIEEIAIQHVLLALPEAPMCAEDCKGLCPVCGTDRNRESCSCALPKSADSRWAGLSQIKIDPKG
ncbi:MAG: YceD family protein [Myxococcota bacterium]